MTRYRSRSRRGRTDGVNRSRSRRGRTDGVKRLSDSGPSRPEPSRDATGDVIATVTVEVHGVKEAGVLPWPGRWAGRVSVP